MVAENSGVKNPEQRKKKKSLREKFIDRILPIAERTEELFPTLKKEMVQAGMKDRDKTRYVAEQMFNALTLAFYSAAGLVIVGLIFGETDFYGYAAIISPVILIFGTFTFIKKPRAEVNKRMRDIEKELPYAMRHLLIEVEAGIPLYQAMVSITEGYGAVSEEFKKIVNEINAGEDEVKALENAVLRNPSQKFRRGLWQIINALRSGSDISNTLSSLVDNLIQQQILQVEKYGEELNPYTLMYMLIAIIMPSLGVTFFMMLSTFTGSEVSNNMFYGVLVGLTVFQMFFINLVSTKRPKVKT